jgi:hypothetical protein
MRAMFGRFSRRGVIRREGEDERDDARTGDKEGEADAGEEARREEGGREEDESATGLFRLLRLLWVDSGTGLSRSRIGCMARFARCC